MSAQDLEGLDRTVQLTHVWINDLDQRLEWNNKSRSYRLLKAVLHALRDSLKVDEAVDLGTQLPGLLRGAYYEQWKPAATPTKHNSIEKFLERVQASFVKDPLADPAQAVMAVFQLLTRKISEGEIENVKDCLPAKIRTNWPESHKSPGVVRH